MGKFGTRICVTGSLVQGSECGEVLYKNRSVGKFCTRIGVSGSFVQESECGEILYKNRSVGKFCVWIGMMGSLQLKKEAISTLKRNKSSCNSYTCHSKRSGFRHVYLDADEKAGVAIYSKTYFGSNRHQLCSVLLVVKRQKLCKQKKACRWVTKETNYYYYYYYYYNACGM